MLTNVVQGSAAGAASMISANENRDRPGNGVRVPPDDMLLYHQEQAAAAQAAVSGTATSSNAGDIYVSVCKRMKKLSTCARVQSKKN